MSLVGIKLALFNDKVVVSILASFTRKPSLYLHRLAPKNHSYKSARYSASSTAQKASKLNTLANARGWTSIRS